METPRLDAAKGLEMRSLDALGRLYSHPYGEERHETGSQGGLRVVEGKKVTEKRILGDT